MSGAEPPAALQQRDGRRRGAERRERQLGDDAFGAPRGARRVKEVDPLGVVGMRLDRLARDERLEILEALHTRIHAERCLYRRGTRKGSPGGLRALRT